MGPQQVADELNLVKNVIKVRAGDPNNYFSLAWQKSHWETGKSCGIKHGLLSNKMKLVITPVFCSHK